MIVSRRFITALLLVALLLPALVTLVTEDGGLPGREFRRGRVAKALVIQISFVSDTPTVSYPLPFDKIHTDFLPRAFLTSPSHDWLHRFLLVRYQSRSNFV